MKPWLILAAFALLVVLGISLIDLTEPRLLTLDGQLDAVARGLPIPQSWEATPADVSAKICPLLDEVHLRQIASDGLNRRIDYGFCLAEDRVLLVTVDAKTLECKAHLALMPPNCLP